MAGWPGNALLHDFSGGPPSGPGLHAHPPTRFSLAESDHLQDVELGKIVERVRLASRPRQLFLETHLRTAALGCPSSKARLLVTGKFVIPKCGSIAREPALSAAQGNLSVWAYSGSGCLIR